jgi:hypothetical protein
MLKDFWAATYVDDCVNFIYDHISESLEHIGEEMIPLHYSGHKFCRIIHQNLGVRK